MRLKGIAKLDYLQISTTLHFFPKKDVGFSLIAGGYVAYLLSAQDQVYAYKDKQEIMHESNLLAKDKDTVTRYDAGVTLGLGCEWKIGLDLSLISDMGLVKVFQFEKELQRDTTIALQARNLTYYLGIGYNFAKLL